MSLGAQGNTFRRLVGSLGRRIGIFKFCYLLCALFYAAVVIYWGRFDLGRVHREYRQASSRIESGYAGIAARREVEAGCRASVGAIGPAAVADCLKSAAPLVAQRTSVISRQLQLQKRQVVKKLLIFYTLFGVMLVLLPVILVYGLLVGLIFILTSIRIDKGAPDKISTEE